MKAVGIKALKAKLSEYLRFVKTGETILVLERDEVIAELRPSRRQSPIVSDLEESLTRLAEKGSATLRSVETKNWKKIKSDAKFDTTSESILDLLRTDDK